MKCPKCPKCLEEKSTRWIAKDKKWCEDCIIAYYKVIYEEELNKWMLQKSDQAIDKILKKYGKHYHMTRLCNDFIGWMTEPGYDSSNITCMSCYELYDYHRLIKQWETTEQYICDKNMINIISPCGKCGSKCTPETRTLIDKNRLNFKCTTCDQECDNPNGILQCECEKVWSDIRSIKYKLKNDNMIEADKMNLLEITCKKFICSSIDDCNYACTFEDVRDLLVLPGHERILFGRGLTRADIEKYKPDLLKYYDQDDYFLSYVYICLNCKKNQAFRADHVAFEIGDVFDCPHCNHPFTYFKVSKKGPFKLPAQYQFILQSDHKV